MLAATRSKRVVLAGCMPQFYFVVVHAYCIYKTTEESERYISLAYKSPGLLGHTKPVQSVRFVQPVWELCAVKQTRDS